MQDSITYIYRLIFICKEERQSRLSLLFVGLVIIVIISVYYIWL